MLLPYIGMAEVHKFGQNRDIDMAADEDIIPWGGMYTFPAIPFIPTIVSSSLNDVFPSGTGARTVRIQGLDANWLEIEEDVEMNGTTAVVLTKTYIRVNRAFVLTVDSILTNDGDIDVLNGATIVARIPMDLGQTQQLVFSFPANWTNIRLHGLHLTSHITIAADVIVSTRYRDFGLGFRDLGHQFLSGTAANLTMENLVADALSAKGDIRVTANTTQNNTAVTGDIYFTATELPRNEFDATT